MSATVRDNPEQSRYEIHDGDTLAGFSQYKLTGDRIAFVHTETDAAFAGRGMASRLVTGMLDELRQRRLAVLPFCPYVRKFIAEHPAYLDLVPEDQRARFDLAQQAAD